jgi:hypothetical protein
MVFLLFLRPPPPSSESNCSIQSPIIGLLAIPNNCRNRRKKGIDTRKRSWRKKASGNGSIDCSRRDSSRRRSYNDGRNDDGSWRLHVEEAELFVVGAVIGVWLLVCRAAC